MPNYMIKQDARGVYYQDDIPGIVRGLSGRFIQYNLNVLTAAQMAFNDLLVRLQEREKRTFQRGQIRWKPLNPKYKRWKARHGLSTQKLIATGDLYRSLTTKTNLSITDLTNYRAGFRVKFGTKRKYAWTHQYGTSKIPQRRFLTLIGARGDAPYFISRYNLYLKGLTAQSGGKGGGTPPTGAGAYSGAMAAGFLFTMLNMLGMISRL